MGQAMGLNGVEALEVEYRLEEPVGGRIAIDRRHDVGAEGGAERGLAVERILVGLPDQLCRHIGVIESLGDTVDHRRLERIMVQDGRVDEGRELGLAPHHLLGFGPNPRPAVLARMAGPGIISGRYMALRQSNQGP